MTSGALLAVLASVGYGVSDVMSGAVVRRHATAALALWAQLTGLVVLGLAGAVVRPSAALPGLGLGACAGALGAGGVLAYYTALQRGATSVVTPVAGTGVVLPVLAGVAAGDALGWRAGAGVVAVVAGVLLVAATSATEVDEPVGRDERPTVVVQPVPGRTQSVPPVADGCVPGARAGAARSAVLLAGAAAAAFGGFFVLLEQATVLAPPAGGGSSGSTALLVALAVQVGALAVTLLAATRHTLACLTPSRALALPATVIGVLDVGADLLVTAAVDRGPIAVVAPLASLDPVVAVLVATVVLGERPRRLPALGVVLALAGIVLTAAG